MKYLIFKLIVFSLVVFVGSAVAHLPPDRLQAAVQFPDTNVPVIDGLEDDWAAVPLDQYAIQSEDLFSVHGFSESPTMDPNSMQIRHIIGWNPNNDNIYWVSRIFDNEHTIVRQDLASYWWDDSLEYQLRPVHYGDAAESGLPEGATSDFKWSFAVPALENSIGPMAQRSPKAATYMTNGSKFFHFAWTFDGEEFGEGTYIYELRLLAMDYHPSVDQVDGDLMTEDQIVFSNLDDNQIIHYSLYVSDTDGGAGDGDNRIGMWATDPEQC